jgi:hypothetical protein
MDDSKRKRVVCPVTGKDGKTYWLRMGMAFVNKDNSINLYLDGLPMNGKLQVRDWDDPPWEKKERDNPTPSRAGHFNLGSLPQGDPSEELPF